MKHRALYIFLLLPFGLFAQRNDLRGDSVNIKKIILHLVPDMTAKTISGKASIIFSPRVSNLAAMRFDLLRMKITQLRCSPVSCIYTYNDSLIDVQFGSALTRDSDYILTIDYNGSPMQDASAWGGWYWNGNYAFNLGVGFQSIPHNLGRAWFPCIDNFKVRQAFEITVSCPQHLAAVSNGILVSKTDTGGYSTFSYRISQPVPAYLACCNVGPYVFINDTLLSSDNRVLQIRIAAAAADTVKVKLSFQKLKATVSYFESLFGPYPFDVVGYSLVPFGSGAMEHAANIAYPSYAADGGLNYETLWAHELSHQWWGDNITCANPEEMWINEGWASYCERLFTEHFYGHDAYQRSIDDNHRYCLQFAHLKDKGYYPLDSVPQQYTYSAHSYQKGCDMIHGLRYLDPSGFFAGCKKLHMQKRYTAVTTDTVLHYFTGADTYAKKLYFQNRSYVSNKLEQTQITSTSPGFGYASKLATYDISPYPSMALPVQISYMDSTSIMVAVNGSSIPSNGWYPSTPLPHNEFRTFFDLQNRIPDANTSEHRWISSTGSAGYDNTICNVNITQLTDSAFLYINRSWDYTGGTFLQPGIQSNSKGFWIVDGFFLGKLKGTLRFQYNGAQPTAYSGYESVDLGYITQSEDSLILLYRENYMAPWAILNTAVRAAGSVTDKRGSFLVNEINRGQYCIGQFNYAKTGPGPGITAVEFDVFPNPSRDRINVILPHMLLGSAIQLISATGQELYNQQAGEEKNTIPVEQYPKGIYFLRVQNETFVGYQKLLLY
jgi:hypothetical protein